MTRAKRARRLHSRRGQLQISFHFIYALVGGFLFLLFFFVLIHNVTKSGGEKDTRMLSFQVESILKSASATPDTFTVSRLPSHDYRFVCDMDDQGMFSYVRIDKGAVPDQHIFDHTPIFTPRLIKGDKLFTLTRTWEAPFPITNLLMASNNRTRYIIVDAPSAIAQGAVEEFIKAENLQSFNIEPLSSASLSSYQDEGFDAYRFILFNGGVGNIPSALRKKSAVLVVHGAPEKGLLDFYDSLEEGASPTATITNIPYVGDALLDAAIFSSAPVFLCNRAKAYEKLNATLVILKKRIDLIQETSLSQPPADWTMCNSSYNRAKGLLDKFQENPNSAFAQAINEQGPLPELEHLNRELLNHEGCPLIY